MIWLRPTKYTKQLIQFKTFSCGYWFESHTAKNARVKNNRSYNINFSKLQARKQVTATIMLGYRYNYSKNFQWKIPHFIKFNWNLLQTVRKSTTIYHLHRYKTDTESFIPPGCHMLLFKNQVTCIKFQLYCLYYYYNMGHLKRQIIQDPVYWW